MLQLKSLRVDHRQVERRAPTSCSPACRRSATGVRSPATAGVPTARIWSSVVRVRVRDLDAEPVEEGEVGAELGLGGRLGLELRVAGLAERDARRSRRCTSRTARRSAASSRRCRARRGAGSRSMKPTFQNGSLRHTPHRRDPAERRPAVAGAEQRAAVVPEGALEDVAVLVVRARAGEEAHRS